MLASNMNIYKHLDAIIFICLQNYTPIAEIIFY